MPAKCGKERPLLERFISVYQNDTWAEADLDWVDEREDGAVELLATRGSDGATLAIEHTLIQPYPREKEDFARFQCVFLHSGRDVSLENPEAVLYVDVPGGTLQPGDDWDAVAEAVYDCVRRSKQTLPEGRSDLPCSIAGGKTIILQIRLQPIPGHDGQTIIRRYGPFDLSSTIRTALGNKLPKLVATNDTAHGGNGGSRVASSALFGPPGAPAQCGRCRLRPQGPGSVSGSRPTSEF